MAVAVGNTIGAGILRAPGEIAGQLPHGGLFAAVWVIGGLYALLGAAQIYLLMNLSLLYVLPVQAIAGQPFAAGALAEAAFGRYGIFTIVVILSMLSAINAYHLMASRVLFAMSRDGLLSSEAASVNAGGTPAVALFLSQGSTFVLYLPQEDEAMSGFSSRSSSPLAAVTGEFRDGQPTPVLAAVIDREVAPGIADDRDLMTPEDRVVLIVEEDETFAPSCWRRPGRRDSAESSPHTAARRCRWRTGTARTPSPSTFS